MKKLATKGLYIFAPFILFLFVAFNAAAQYTSSNLETGGLYTAMAKDGSNNLYVVRVKPGTSGAGYELEKYTNGSGAPSIIYPNLKHEVEDFPWGIAVTSLGNVFIATDFTTASGQIIKLTIDGTGHYTSSIYQSGRYFTSVAVDASDNLYTTEYDAANLTYAVVKYPANSGSNTAGTKLYDALKSGAGYAYPTGLAVAGNGDVYVNDAFSNDPSVSDGGRVYKLTAASAYAVSTISSGNYSSALALDAAGNLYTSENRGSGYSLIKYANATGAGVPIFNGLHTNGIYYPWGIAVYSLLNIYLVDGDDGTTGGAVLRLLPSPPSATTYPVTATTTTGTTLNGVVNDNGYNTTVSFNYGTSPTLTGATNVPATTGGTITAGTGNTPVAVSITGLTPSTTYYYDVSATNTGGTALGAIASFITTPTISYTTPKTYNSGVTIPPLTPVSSTVPAPAYSSNVTFGSGYTSPFGVAADASGNIYVADPAAKTIGKIPVGGGAIVTVLSGFVQPTGVAVDAAGNLYVADAGNTTINKYLAGTTTPIAIGSGFSSPYGIAVDSKGNVYVADFSGNSVSEIPAAGGAPVAIGSGFANPTGVATDAAGNVYVADYGNGAVKEIVINGGTTIGIGSGFTSPVGITIDPAGDIFVADYGASAVDEIPAGTATPVTLGSGYYYPTGVTIDGAGKLTVANYLGNNIQQLTPVGGFYLSTALPLGLQFNSSTGTISGIPAKVTPAANYTVIAYNAGGGTPAVVNIKIAPNVNLLKLLISNVTLSPVFSSGTTSYTASVVNGIATVTVTPTAADAAATITVNGLSIPSGYSTDDIPLNAGPNTITTIVTAQDGSITKTYTVTITRAPSSNANLSSIGSSITPLTPGFNPNTTSYTLSVNNGITSMTVTPVSSEPNATITVNGTAITSGTVSGPIALTEGVVTNINVVVTAQDGTTVKTYTIAVTRAPSSNASLASMGPSVTPLTPSFTPATTSYTLSVPFATTSMTVKPVANDANATIKVNGTTVASGTVSGPIALAEGTQTVITVFVTAQDGTTTRTYTITVTRGPSTDASLSNIQLSAGTLSPAFATGTASYTASVPNTASSITVTPTSTDANASIKVNGLGTTSGSPSGSIGLAVGPNTITVAITAQDGSTTQSYTIVVTRAPSANANLIAINPSVTPLSPSFTQANTSYTISAANSVASMTVKPIVSDTGARIKVNGVAVASGTLSGPITLAPGAQTVINIVVTAANHTTTKTYTVTVTRAPSSDAALSNLQVSTGTLSPEFGGETTSFTVSYPNTVSSITVTPTTDDANATVKVNGVTVASGTASGAIPLSVGPNVITTVVTAQDGTTTKTYTITASRSPSTNANLASMGPSVGPLTPTFAPGTTSYTLSVANSVSSMTVKPVSSDANATIKVNGTTVASGTTSGAIALAVGPNTVSVVVTAQDGTTTKTYTITVTRASGGADSYDPGLSVNNPNDRPSLDDDIIAVHQGISPNGDGLNDFLVIDGIQAYPDNKLSIMNRNGQMVYEAQGYDNSSKVFDGHSSKNGQMQLPGTYFYQLDYTIKGVTKHKTGFIVLKY